MWVIFLEKRELIANIKKLKAETGALIMAHTYQSPDIIALADVTGDSFKLAQVAAKQNAEKIILCGVRFMAETAKIMAPNTQIILPAPQATCPMAEQIPFTRVMQFKKDNLDTAVCCYINTTIELKAEADVCVTSSSAVNIIKKMPEKKILFIPDKNLGSYVAEQCPEKEIILWHGFCPVHNAVRVSDVEKLKKLHPDAPIAVHPECNPEVTALADLAGSTSEIIDFAKAQSGDVIIVTEKQVARYLTLTNPGRHFYTPCPDTLTCRDMGMVTLENIYAALTGEGGEDIALSEELRLRAKKAIDKMLLLGSN